MYQAEQFQKSSAVHLPIPKVKAVLGTNPKMSGLREALISEMILCGFFHRNLKYMKFPTF